MVDDLHRPGHNHWARVGPTTIVGCHRELRVALTVPYLLQRVASVIVTVPGHRTYLDGWQSYPPRWSLRESECCPWWCRRPANFTSGVGVVRRQIRCVGA